MLPKKNKLRPYLALLRLNCKKIKPFQKGTGSGTYKKASQKGVALEASYKPIFFVLRSKSQTLSTRFFEARFTKNYDHQNRVFIWSVI